jgi:predicted CXXCH cytochrome family protein
MSFPRTHLRAGLALGIAVTLVAGGRGVSAEDDCISAKCHATLVAGKVVHGPSESCDTCHESVATPHPQEGKKTFKLSQEPPELCAVCHDAIGTKSNVHAPVKAGMCASCHDPHSANEAKLLLQPAADQCSACHDDKGKLANVHAGDCTTCHVPHDSDFAPLLSAEFPPNKYVPYSDSAYALCFSCHDLEMLEKPQTGSATEFRDGERNLHYVHVHDVKKGRSCQLCHAVHGTRGPSLVADAVPFGKWNLPLKFVKTETGGSCAPGCHTPAVYDRTTPGKKPEAAKPAK